MRFSRRVSIGAPRLAATRLTAWATRAGFSAYYDGPASDHFDGARFFDPHGMPPKSVAELVRWLATRTAARWPEQVALAATDTPPPRVADAHCRISWIGHASMLINPTA